MPSNCMLIRLREHAGQHGGHRVLERACSISDCPHLTANKEEVGNLKDLKWPATGEGEEAASQPHRKQSSISGEASRWKQAVPVVFFSSLWKTGEQEGQPATGRLRDTVRKALHPLIFLTCAVFLTHTGGREGSQGWRAELGAVTWCSRS